jgi:ribonuclease HII
LKARVETREAGVGRVTPGPDGLGGLTRPGDLSLEQLRLTLAALKPPPPHRVNLVDIERLEALGRALAADPRVGARKQGHRLLRLAEFHQAHRRRVAAMFETEARLCPSDALHVAGMDEAGRGPLAGPVVAAVVVLREGTSLSGLNDSKQVPEEVREELYETIAKASLYLGVGVAGPGLIERVNILQATYVAMRRAVAKLGTAPDYLLVDGFRVPGLDVPHRGVVGGDALCASIAAASIIAKVTRDRIMRQVAKRYPVYGFERNKGYGTAEHWEALRRHGPCPAHRPSFMRRGEETGAVDG